MIKKVIKSAIDRVRKGPRYRYRRSDTGKFCTRLYALLFPASTEKERVR